MPALRTITGNGLQVSAGLVTVANSNSNTSVLDYPVTPGEVFTGNIYRGYGWGVYSTTGTPTLTFSVFFGGVGGTQLVALGAITTPTGASNLSFSFESHMSFTDSGHAVSGLEVSFGTAATTMTPYVITPSAAVAVTATTLKNFSTCVQWGTASASNTLTLLTGYVERIL